MEKHWAGNTDFWDINCMFLVLYLWLSWCRSKKIPQGNSKLSYYDEKSQVTVKVWKHSTGSSTAWAQPQLSSGRVPSTGFGEQAAVGCMTWVWSCVWKTGMSPAAGFISSVRLTFCHFFFFFNKRGHWNITKDKFCTVALVFASEFICKTAGDVAVILKFTPSTLQHRGNCCSIYGPPLSILLLIQWKGLVV